MSDSMLLEAMSIAELEKFKVDYSTNESIVKIVDGYIEIKARQEAQAKAKEEFGKAIGKLVAKLPHPEDVHNVYLRWAKHQEPVEGSEPEEVTLADGTVETRQPTTDVWGWEVDLNKGFAPTRSSGNGTTPSKRAITLYKRNGLENTLIGNFSSASKACQHLGIMVGGDSATRVLNREGYILDPYTGTDITA